MFFHSEKTPGIAAISYVVGDGGEALVIDPQLDCQRYIDTANKHNCRIIHILETHRNEDFISGAAQLASLTGADVWHGPNPDRPISYAKTIYENDAVSVGNLLIKAIETPGHTKDSMCYTLVDTNFSDEPVGVFTGDTLFVGDVGRTDFYPGEEAKMAEALHTSLNKLFELGDQVQIFPAHGSGSVCGSGMADREYSTLGYERRFNPSASETKVDAFVKLKTSEAHYKPPYFEAMEAANVEGETIQLADLQCQPVVGEDRAKWLNPKTRPGTLLDVRDLHIAKQQYVLGSLCFNDSLISAYAGWFLVKRPDILLLADNHSQARDAHLQLLRMGIDTVLGYTTSTPVRKTQDDPIMSELPSVTADVVKERLNGAEGWTLLDVRKQEEVESNPMPGAKHIYLGHLASRHEKLDKNKHYTVMCGSGKRATVAASFLKANGFRQVDIFDGSMIAWKAIS